MNSKDLSVLYRVREMKKKEFVGTFYTIFPEMLFLILVLAALCLGLIAVFIGVLPCTSI